jgi:hypothetical protein
VPIWLAETVSVFGAACKTKLEGPGEPEEAIRAPLESLLTSVGSQLGLSVVPYGEAALKELGARPDYAVRVDGAVTGYIEVKRPRLSIDEADFRGRNLVQWRRLRDLPNLLYTNGSHWRLHQAGSLVMEAALDRDLRRDGSALKVSGPEFERTLTNFFHWKPVPITSVARLVSTVAPLCRLLRAAVVEQLADERRAAIHSSDDAPQPFTALAHDWRNLLFPTADDVTFADGYAQAITFALLLARTEGMTLAEKGLHQIGEDLGSDHLLMGKALQILTEGVPARFKPTLDLMVRVVASVDWAKIRVAKEDAYPRLYENFLSVYDEDLRKQSGSYYTPREVVTEMVRLTDDVLRTRLGCAQGYLSPNVLTVDPAMGTGTYLHSVVEHVAGQVAETTGPGAVPAAVGKLAKALVGFELQMGPFAVGEMRTADLLKRYGADVPKGGMQLYVTSTLDDPYLEQTQLGSGYEPIAKSRRAANKIKASTPVTVVMSNPPYREHAQNEGSWIEQGTVNVTAPLDAFRLEGNGKFEYVLKNLYVYFWRWATWKVFDAHQDDSHGVVSFITTSGYLRGQGFKGMRRYLRERCDEGWIINVTPEGMRPDVPTRVFPGVQQPLAIGIFVRKADTCTATPAAIHYTEVTGHRDLKYAQLQALTLDGEQWRKVRSDWEAPFTPAALGGWDNYPALGELLPWQAPGIKPNRTWVYAPSEEILVRRWSQLVGESNDLDKRTLLVTNSQGGRDLDTVVQPLEGGNKHVGPIGMEKGPCPAAVRVGYRSFDRQWLIPDNRLIDRARPELWAARIPGQLFLIEQASKPIDSGPGVIFSALIPDMDHFKGSEGGRALPMLHPDGSPNLAPGLVDAIAAALGLSITPQDVIAYIAGVIGHPAFTARFTDELVTPGIRVPITAAPDLWERAVTLGQHVIWAATYGAVLHDDNGDRPQDDIAYPAGDARRPMMLKPLGTTMPETIQYHSTKQELHLGPAVFGPVPERVWLYDVGGMQVVKKWFGYRKTKPGGKKTSPLDDIHADRWPLEWAQEFVELLTVLNRLVELERAQAELLDQVVATRTITIADLTQVGVFPVSASAGKIRRGFGIENTLDGALF